MQMGSPWIPSPLSSDVIRKRAVCVNCKVDGGASDLRRRRPYDVHISISVKNIYEFVCTFLIFELRESLLMLSPKPINSDETLCLSFYRIK